MGHVIIVGSAMVAGLWTEKNSIKGICEQKPGLAEGFSLSALLRLSPWGCVRLAFSSAQDAPGLHPSCRRTHMHVQQVHTLTIPNWGPYLC